MIKNSTILLSVLSSICILLSENCLAQKATPAPEFIFHLLTEDNPPYQSEDPVTKKISGISIDVIAAIFSKAGIGYDVTVLPWARAYNKALTNKNVGVFGTFKTTERESLFDWIGPISKSRWVLFARSDSTIKISTLEEAGKFRIGGYIGDAKTKFVEDRGLKVDAVSSNDLNINKLIGGRIDLWIAGDVSGRAIAANQKISEIKEVLSFHQTEGFIALNKNSDKAALSKLRQAATEMNGKGEIDLIIKKHQN